MAAQAPLTVFDGANTPLSHTFAEDGAFREVNNITAHWKELSASLPAEALNRITFRQQKQKNGIVRCAVRVEFPVMESVSGVNAQGYTAAPRVAYVETAEYVSYVHTRSTELGRRIVRQVLLNLMGNIATSVAPATAGQAVVFVDRQLPPS